MLFTILFMYAFVLALVPFIAFCLHQMHTGDQMRDRNAAARVAALASGAGTQPSAIAPVGPVADLPAPTVATGVPARAAGTLRSA